MHAPAIREKVFAYLRVKQMRAQAFQRFLLIKKRLGVDNPIALAWLTEQLGYAAYFALTAAMALPAFAFLPRARAWIGEETLYRSA